MLDRIGTPDAELETRSGRRGLLAGIIDALSLPLRIYRRSAEITAFYEAQQTSMLPTIRPGDRIQATKVSEAVAPFERGSIVVFESWHEGEGAAMKRVIALPGEELEIRDHQVLIDGTVLEEPYAIGPTHGTLPPTKLGPDMYFLMGDNRCQSCDSRRHGPVHATVVTGVAVFRDRPLHRMGFLE